MDEPWPSEWIRAIAWICVLQVIADLGSAHGYAIGDELHRRGLGTLKGGTLYPMLRRSERDGLLAAQWQDGESGPGRRVYRLTAQGRIELARTVEQWSEFTAVTNQMLKGKGDIR